MTSSVLYDVSTYEGDIYLILSYTADVAKAIIAALTAHPNGGTLKFRTVKRLWAERPYFTYDIWQNSGSIELYIKYDQTNARNIIAVLNYALLTPFDQNYYKVKSINFPWREKRYIPNHRNAIDNAVPVDNFFQSS